MREVVSAAEWRQRAPELEAEGFHVGVLREGIGEDPVNGYTIGDRARDQMREALRGEESEAWHRSLDRSDEGKVIMVTGRDEERVREAIELDRFLVAAYDIDGEAEHVHRHGALLGYPECCLDSFVNALPVRHNHQVIKSAAAVSKEFNYLLNNLSLTLFYFTGWYPCSYDCAASIDYAERLDAVLTKERPDQRKLLHWALSMPRLYIDDRRQFVFAGYPDAEDRIRYSAIHSPWTLDHKQRTAGIDWVFFLTEVWPLAQGNRIEIGTDELRVFSGNTLLTRLPRDPKLVVLPFKSILHY